jgi:adenylate kinase family enzyme
MTILLPSRYEDLEEAYRGRLAPNDNLNQLVQKAVKSMSISGGIRFLPIYGESGSGKSCASREIDRHLPETHVFLLERDEIEDGDKLLKRIDIEKISHNACLIGVIDEFEEQVSGKENIPSQFIEKLSIYDRNHLRNIPILFIWLTTNRDFQKNLQDSTSRNSRLLLARDFEVSGPASESWPHIIQETFTFHNSEKPLADYNVVEEDLDNICKHVSTVGEALQAVGDLLGDRIPSIQNLSEYRVILVWPVADGARMQRVLQFSRPREGYLLNWDAWRRELNIQDRETLPLQEYNRARLYFDVRVVPLRVADIHKLCENLDNSPELFAPTYIHWFQKTHLYQILSGNWDKYDYSPVKERESKRAEAAKNWYSSVTNQPTKIGRRLSLVLKTLGYDAIYEKEIDSKYSRVKADVFIEASAINPKKQILELKVFSSENTMPSSIKEQIKITLRRHAQFAGFIGRQ